MKKVFVFIISVLLLSVAVVFFVSCSKIPIFASIELEVKLKKPSLPATVRGVCKIGSKLYAANGSVYTKSPGNTGKWSKISSPVDAVCFSIATDGSSLYATFVDHYSDKGKGVYKYNGSSWSYVSGSDGIQAVIGSGTKVYGIKTSISYDSLKTIESGKMYAISGSTATFFKDMDTFQKEVQGTSRKNTYVHHIKASGNGYYATEKGLFDSSGNKISGAPSGIKVIDSTGTYFLTSDKVYKLNNWSSGVSHSVSNPSGAVVLTFSGKTRLLISSESSGYAEVLIDTGNFANSTSISIGSANSTTPSGQASQYKSSVGSHSCNCIFADTTGGGSGYFVYLGINDSNYGKYTGLWGFYNPGQLEWNRE
ncbi:MAG: hypothetical protein CR988_08105 [Treponema sp.]|nr:MAG: hypothetical protein CR988_08105 [Treponema sp.]